VQGLSGRQLFIWADNWFSRAYAGFRHRGAWVRRNDTGIGAQFGPSIRYWHTLPSPTARRPRTDGLLVDGQGVALLAEDPNGTARTATVMRYAITRHPPVRRRTGQAAVYVCANYDQATQHPVGL
jgi:hypothetical protein